MKEKTAEQINNEANARAAMRAVENHKEEGKAYAFAEMQAQAKRLELERAAAYVERQKVAFLTAMEANRTAAREVKEWEHAAKQAKERCEEAMKASIEWVKITPAANILAEVANG